MKELEHLRTMWAPKLKRKTKLIVPAVTYSKRVGSLNNEHWEFNVPYAFRDALDIKYEQRMKDKEPYMIWTQGPILNFKEGDSLTTRNGKKVVQIQSANPMGWDDSKNEMCEGSVIYDEFDIDDGKCTKRRRSTCSQMQFLRMLIYGAYDC